jgi:hypothetical protein
MFGLCVAFMLVSLVSQIQMDRLSSQGTKHLYHKVSDAAELQDAGASSKAEAGAT